MIPGPGAVPDQPASQVPIETRELLPLHGKIVLITGGTRDFGGALTRELARQGATLIVGYREKDPLNNNKRSRETVKTLRELGATVEFVQGDITTVEGIQALADAVDRVSEGRTAEQGKVDFLILNAAAPSREVNVVGNNALLDAMIPRMGKGSAVAFIQSYQGQFEPLAQELGLIPDEYGIVASTKKEAGDSLRERIPEMQERGIHFATFVLPALPESTNAQIFAHRDPTAPVKNRQLTALLGLPETATNDESAKKIVIALAKGISQNHLDLLGPYLSGKHSLDHLYGKNAVFVDVKNTETHEGRMLVTPSRVDLSNQPSPIDTFELSEDGTTGTATVIITPEHTDGHLKIGAIYAGHRQFRSAMATIKEFVKAYGDGYVSVKPINADLIDYGDPIIPGQTAKITATLKGRNDNRFVFDLSITAGSKNPTRIENLIVDATTSEKYDTLYPDILIEGAGQSAALEVLAKKERVITLTGLKNVRFVPEDVTIGQVVEYHDENMQQ
ncbi:MAG: SDR family NAD(P)-dependent oxidoreductase, partial [Candidatus Levybacteria bacterium]|nr:SDR family NAD(P)-dependent oxidoreductase [Candidatus Levybacteria bacterium]